MKFFHNLSIKYKLIIIIVSVSFFSVLLLLTYSTLSDIQRIRSELSRNTAQIADTVGSYAITDLTFVDKEAARKTLYTLRGLPNLTGAALFDNNKKLFAFYGQTGNIDINDLEKPARFKDGFLHITHKITENEKDYGYLYLQMSTRQLNNEIFTSVFLGASLFIIIMIFSFVMASKLQKLISVPILKLTDFARQVQTSHDFSQQIDKLSNDETGSLYTQFNQLLHSIEEEQQRRDIAEQKLQKAKDELELRVKYRTRELETAMNELETFSYSVSHDLRSPLRSIDGFSKILLEDYASVLDETGKGHLTRVCNATHRMGDIIDDILLLSRVSRTELEKTDINLTELCKKITDRLHEQHGDERNISIKIQDNMHIKADKKLILLAFENLIANAWKYTRDQTTAVIEINLTESTNEQVISIKDNGAGFDMAYSNKLFQPLQRLHTDSQFEGSGIGLATVYRVISKHNGSIRAEGKVDQGACFWITLPVKNDLDNT